jgi:hypothetical protein
MDSIGNLIKSFGKSNSAIARGVTASLVIEEFEKMAVEKWGKQILEELKVVSLKRGVLSLAVLSAPLAGEIRLNKNFFLDAINRRFGPVIIELKIVL